MPATASYIPVTNMAVIPAPEDRFHPMAPNKSPASHIQLAPGSLRVANVVRHHLSTELSRISYRPTNIAVARISVSASQVEQSAGSLTPNSMLQLNDLVGLGL